MPLRSFTQAELVLTERRRVERPLLMLIWLSVSAFSLAEGSLFYLLAGTVAVGVNLAMVYRAKELYVDRTFVNLGVLAATGVLVIEMLAESAGLLAALGHYLILIQLCKLFERKTNRDYVQMLTLSLLLMVAGGLICIRHIGVSLLFAGATTAYVVLACYTAMVFTLKRGLDAAAAARLRTEPAPLAPHRVAWNVIRDWPVRAILWRLVVVAGVMFAWAAAVFLILPRATRAVERASGLSAPLAVSGFSTTVSLGEPRSVELSDRVMMHVSVRGARGRQTSPSVTYLRGQVFHVYENSRWRKWPRGEPSPRYRRILPAPPEDLVSQATVLDVSMVPGLLPNLFAPYPVLRVETAEGDVRVGPSLELSMRRGLASDAPVRYTVYCLSPPFTSRQMDYLGQLHPEQPLVWADPADGAEVTDSVRALATDWCADLLEQRAAAEAQAGPDARDRHDLAIAWRVLQRLQERCSYTLDLSDAEPSRDAVDDFLFHMKHGHCEYFATAMTVMCRSLGVRARLATGFQVTEYDQAGRRYVVRQRDAHAWTEVYTPSTDWVVMDPTPAGGRQSQSGGWLAGLKALWEDLQFLWYQHVLNYNAEARERLARRLQDALADAWRAVTDAAEALKESFTGLLLRGEVDRILVRFAAVVGAGWLLVFGIIVIRLARRRVRALRAARRNPAMSPRFLAFLRKLLAVLQRHGICPRQGQTLRELAAEAAAALELPAGALKDLVGLYYRMRWGGIVPRTEELSAAEEQADRLRAGLSR